MVRFKNICILYTTCLFLFRLELVQQFRHLQIATQEAKEDLASAEKTFEEFLCLKKEKMKWHKIRFNQNLVSVLMARKQILDIQVHIRNLGYILHV